MKTVTYHAHHAEKKNAGKIDILFLSKHILSKMRK